MRSAPHRRPISEPLEPRVLLARVEGVDVSLFQGSIDWNVMRARGKDFAFIRSSRTNLELDSRFHENVANATASGLIVGPYQRVLPMGESEGGVFTDPITDARRFVNAAGSIMDTGFIRPVIDVEDGNSLGREALSQWVNNFSDEVFRLKGVRPIIYANGNYATNFLNESVAERHDLWIARWNGGNANLVNPQIDQPETPAGFVNSFGVWNDPIGGPPNNSVWDFWQYTSNGDGRAHGASSARLDLDVFNGDMETLRRNFMIGFQKNFPGDTPFAVGPGVVTVIQAEDYDIGGQDVSYSDATPALNDGGVYRTSVREGVDLAPNAEGGADFRIRNTAPGEYVEYTIDVAQSDEYMIAALLSQVQPGATFHLEIDGQALPFQDVPNTDSFTAFAPVAQNVGLSAGRHVVRIAFDNAAPSGLVADVDRLEISQTPDPPAAPPPPPSLPPGIADAGAHVVGGLSATQNFGQASELLVQRGRGASNTKFTVLRFNLGDRTSLASGKLRLTGRLSDNVVSSLATNVFGVGRSRTVFDENTVTFKNKPNGRKRLGAITVTGTADGSYELDITQFLQAELAAGRKVVTLVLRNATRSDTTNTVFASDEVVAGPVLTVS